MRSLKFGHGLSVLALSCFERAVSLVLLVFGVAIAFAPQLVDKSVMVVLKLGDFGVMLSLQFLSSLSVLSLQQVALRLRLLVRVCGLLVERLDLSLQVGDFLLKLVLVGCVLCRVGGDLKRSGDNSVLQLASLALAVGQEKLVGDNVRLHVAVGLELGVLRLASVGVVLNRDILLLTVEL
jgi:hypothetical protein